MFFGRENFLKNNNNNICFLYVKRVCMYCLFIVFFFDIFLSKYIVYIFLEGFKEVLSR